MNLNGFSIIICCHNSSKRLFLTLKHLSEQKLDNIPWELIIVDNNSTDNTSHFAKTSWRNFNSTIEIKTVKEKKLGLSFARIKGIKVSKYKYIVFCDDDNWLSSNYLEIAYSILNKDSKIGALGGIGLPYCEVSPPEWFKYLSSYYATGKQGYINGDANILYGAGLVIRKSKVDYLFLNGFEFSLQDRKGKELSTGGDSEICLALKLAKLKIQYDENLKFNHFIPKSRISIEYVRLLRKNWAEARFSLAAYYHTLNGYPNSVLFYLLWMGKNIILIFPNLLGLVQSNMKKKYECFEHFIFLKNLLFNPIHYFKVRRKTEDLAKALKYKK